MSRSGPIGSLVLNVDLAYEKNDLDSLLVFAARLISKSPLAFLTVFVALLSAFRYCSWSSALSVLLPCLSLLSDRFLCLSVHP